MDDKNASHVHNGKKTTTLLDLPDEMILYICSFLHTSMLLDLSLVCKRFNEILKKNTFIWKERINRLWPYSDYPILQPANPDELFWKRLCVAIELLEEHSLLRWEMIIVNTELNRIHALLLMHAGSTCIASTSDCSLLYCNIEFPDYIELLRRVFPNRIKFAHNQPICDLTAIDNTIYSCSLDQSVKSWMFINTGLIEQKIYELSGSDGLLCVSSCPERGLFATGSCDGTIFVFDSRRDKPIKQYRPYTGVVIKLAMNSEYILSISRDKTVSVWDQRAGRTMKSITISGDGVPTCMNVQRNWVCVGDSTAELHLLDLKNDSEPMKSYSTKHIGEIIGVHMTDGCLISASSADHNVRFSSLTDPPQPIVKLSSEYEGHYSRMDYLNDTLAVSVIRDIPVWNREELSYIAVRRLKLTYSTKHQGTENFYEHFLDVMTR